MEFTAVDAALKSQFFAQTPAGQQKFSGIFTLHVH